MDPVSWKLFIGIIRLLSRVCVIGGSGTDCLKAGSRNVAEARVATVFYFLQMERTKAQKNSLKRLVLGSGGSFIEREGVSTLSIHGYPWALRYLLTCVFKNGLFAFQLWVLKSFV